MWRVVFRLRGAEEEWNSQEHQAQALEFAHGLHESDAHHLLETLRVEESVSDRWIIRTDLLA